MHKLKLEIDADELSIPVDTVGDLFRYLSAVAARHATHTGRLGVHQPASPIYDAHGTRIGKWSITDGVQTDGSEPGSGIPVSRL